MGSEPFEEIDISKINNSKHYRLNVDKVIEGRLRGMSKQKIAVFAGSKARYPSGKINAVTKVMESEEYKIKAKPFLDDLKKEKVRLIKSITESNLRRVDYDKKVNSLEKINKMDLLLSGSETERIGFKSEELADFLANS